MDSELLRDLLQANDEVFDQAARHIRAKAHAAMEDAMMESAIRADGLRLPHAATLLAAEREARTRIEEIRTLALCETRMLDWKRRNRARGIRAFVQGRSPPSQEP